MDKKLYDPPIRYDMSDYVLDELRRQSLGERINVVNKALGYVFLFLLMIAISYFLF